MQQKNMSFNQDQENILDFHLVDIEDIVPPGANSLFLSCARTLIYMSNRNATFTEALKLCCGITSNDLKSDIHLQNLLRIKLCEYMCENAIGLENSIVCLKDEYSKHFLTVYDFMIQVYQLSANNFSNNPLYKRYAVIGLSNILHMKINLKKAGATQFKTFEPVKSFTSSTEIENHKAASYLNNFTIYLQEFRFDSASHLACKRTVRFLLEKKLWIKNFPENYKMCMSYSQFNDHEQLKMFNELKFSIKPAKIIHLFSFTKLPSLVQKAFCAFINCVSVQALTSISFNQTKNDEIVSVGNKMLKLESLGAEKLKDYFNSLYGEPVFNDEFINKNFTHVINQ